MAVIYLDVDDEITSAAARVRAHRRCHAWPSCSRRARGSRRAGSTSASSRARPPRNRRLAIVAPDASARAVAVDRGPADLRDDRANTRPPVRSRSGSRRCRSAPAPAAGGRRGSPGRRQTRPPRPGRRTAARPRRVRDARHGRDRGPVPQRGGRDRAARPFDGARAGRPTGRPARPRRRRRAVVPSGVPSSSSSPWRVMRRLPAPAERLVMLTVRSAPIGPLERHRPADPAVRPPSGKRGRAGDARAVPLPASGRSRPPDSGDETTPPAPCAGASDPTRAYTIPAGQLVRTRPVPRSRPTKSTFAPDGAILRAHDHCGVRGRRVTAATPGRSGNVAPQTRSRSSRRVRHGAPRS